MEKNLYKTDKKKGENWHDYRTSWNIYPKILKKIKLKKDEKILDAGCGSGELAIHLKGFNLYGIDLLEKAIKKAKEKGYKKVVKSDIYNLSFKNKDFDKTFSIQVFQYLEKPEKAFKELIRVTKKEIVISVPNFNWLKIQSIFSKKDKERYEFCIKHENYTDSRFLRKLAKQNNLKLKIKYMSNRLGFIRNLFGDFLAGEIVGIFELK